MQLESKTPASGDNGGQGKTVQQVSKTYFSNNTLIANGSQHAIHWVSVNYHLSLPMAQLVAELAGLGGER
jgi:hypothetical protein